MAYQAIPPSTSGGDDVGIESMSRSVAAAALGVSASSLVGYVLPIYAQGETGQFSGVGALGSRTSVSGVSGLRLATGANANGNYHIMASSNTVAGARLIQTGAAKKWWVGGVFTKVTSAAILAGDSFGIAFMDHLSGFSGAVGGRGAGSLVNFSAGISGGTGGSLNSGIPFDTSRRLHELWRDGSTGNYRVNLASNFGGSLGSPQAQGNFYPDADATFGAHVLTGGTPNNFAMDVEWVAGWMVP